MHFFIHLNITFLPVFGWLSQTIGILEVLSLVRREQELTSVCLLLFGCVIGKLLVLKD